MLVCVRIRQTISKMAIGILHQVSPEFIQHQPDGASRHNGAAVARHLETLVIGEVRITLWLTLLLPTQKRV